MEVEGTKLCVSCNVAVNVLKKSEEPSDKEILSASPVFKNS